MSRDWRKSAYLKKSNWPEAIPPMGPEREFGPYCWHEKVHHDPFNLDDYPHTHPDAASVGDDYMGDVCPRCGVPLGYNEPVYNHIGEKGKLWDISPDDDPVPCYHPECWAERKAEKNAKENRSLTEWSG